MDSVLGSDVNRLNYNLFTYSDNNYINVIDPIGEIGFLLGCVLVGVFGGGIAGTVVGITESVYETGKTDVGHVATRTTEFALIGAGVGFDVGTVGKNLIKKATTGTPNKIGKIGEKWGRADKHKTPIKVNGNDRIPDIYKNKKHIIGDVKNVEHLTYTRQLRDYVTFAQTNDYKMILRVRSSTTFSKPLQELIDSKIIKIKYLPW